MKAEDYFFAKREGDVVLLTGKSNSRIGLLGSSLTASAPSDGSRYSEIRLRVPKEPVRVIIAGGNYGVSYESFLFEVRLNNDDGWCAINQIIAAKNDALGQSDLGGVTVTTAGGVMYTSDEKYAVRLKALYVPDGNLLCKFLAGMVDEEALKAVAQDLTKPPEPSELEKFYKELGEILGIGANPDHESVVYTVRGRDMSYRRNLEESPRRTALLNAYARLMVAAMGNWWNNADLRAAIANVRKVEEAK